jgi:hypothetical protein
LQGFEKNQEFGKTAPNTWPNIREKLLYLGHVYVYLNPTCQEHNFRVKGFILYEDDLSKPCSISK